MRTPSAQITTLPRGGRGARPRRRHRRAGGLHAPDPVRRRPRDHPPGPPRPRADPDDAGHPLRPDDRVGLRAQARVLVGRQPRRRLAAPLPRRGRERAGRTPLEIEEHSHAGMANRYAAGASDLPFAIMRGYIGTDLVDAHERQDRSTCPFTGEKLTAVPALRPDVGDRPRPARPTGRATSRCGASRGVQKEAVLARQALARDGRGDRRRARAAARRRRHPAAG